LPIRAKSRHALSQLLEWVTSPNGKYCLKIDKYVNINSEKDYKSWHEIQRWYYEAKDHPQRSKTLTKEETQRQRPKALKDDGVGPLPRQRLPKTSFWGWRSVPKDKAAKDRLDIFLMFEVASRWRELEMELIKWNCKCGEEVECTYPSNHKEGNLPQKGAVHERRKTSQKRPGPRGGKGREGRREREPGVSCSARNEQESQSHTRGVAVQLPWMRVRGEGDPADAGKFLGISSM
jgi:hypothetical protein